jgi:exopolysaccharide biosynthesis polyprenyl glycosylphosphotransferase
LSLKTTLEGLIIKRSSYKNYLFIYNNKYSKYNNDISFGIMQYLPEDFYNKKNRAIYAVSAILIDIVLLVFGCALAYYLRFFTALFGRNKPTYTLNSLYIYYSIAFIVITVVLIDVLRSYNLKNIYTGFDYYFKIVLSPVISIIIFVSYSYFIHHILLSRGWLLLLFILSALLLLAGRFITGIILKGWIRNYSIPSNTIAAGFIGCVKAMQDSTRLKRKVIYGAFVVINDIFFIGLALFLAFYIRFFTGESSKFFLRYGVEGNYLLYSIIFTASAILIIFIYRLYDWDSLYKGSGYYFKIIKAITLNVFLLILLGYLFEAFTFSRIYIVMLLVFALFFVLLSRILILFLIQKLIGRLKIYSNTLIVGLDSNVKKVEHTINGDPGGSFNIIGYVEKKKFLESHINEYADYNILGNLENLKDIVLKNKIQRIIISSNKFKYFEMLDILEGLKGLDVLVLMFPGYFDFSIRRMSMRDVSGIPLIHISNIGFFGINLFLKNMIDYVLGTILFILFIPLFLLLAAMIKIDSKGPVFYKQLRYTKDFKDFYMYKFRTMYLDADKKLAELRQFSNTKGPTFKMEKDPRITRMGRFLRRFSVDELPQLINVLRGELSLVGPRPPIPEETKQYDEWHKKRLNIKQGMTGLWQVSGRSDLSFEEMVKLDLYYIQNWSVALDIKILLKTIPTILLGKGSY